MSPDLLVVGAGPAGLAAALYARSAGMSVHVLDSRPGQRDKACGEGLMPPAVAALTSLGVPLRGHRIGGIRYLAGDSVAEARFRNGPGLGVRRTVLSDALHETAVDAGVQISCESAGVVRQDREGVVVNGHRARFLVAADGLHSPIRRSLGLDLPPRTIRRRWGVRRHFTMTPWTDMVEVHWAAGSEAYVTPVADDLVGVAILSGGRAGFTARLDDFPALRERIAGAPAGPVAGAGPLRQRSAAQVSGRVLLVGDSAGYVDALTGEGIALSVLCAQAAVACLVQDDPAAYADRWLRITRRYRWMTHGLLMARRSPAVARNLVPAAARLPRAFDVAVDRLAR